MQPSSKRAFPLGLVLASVTGAVGIFLIRTDEFRDFGVAALGFTALLLYAALELGDEEGSKIAGIGHRFLMRAFLGLLLIGVGVLVLLFMSAFFATAAEFLRMF